MKIDSHYINVLKNKIIIFDGAMGTSLQVMNLTADHFGGEHLVGCNDYLSVNYPQAVENVHRSFYEVGVDVIETNTFRSNRITLKEYDLQDKVNLINYSAASLARRLADEYSTPNHPRFVVGAIGPSGKLPSMNDPELSNITFDELIDVFCEQATSLIKGGVDFIVIETSQDILEVKSSILGVQQAFIESGVHLPLQVQVTLDTTGKMLLGTDILAVLTILEGMPIQIIGLNCSTGPEHMREPIRFLGAHASLPVSCLPNAGLPLNIDGKAVYPLKPEPYSDALVEFVEKFGVNVVGGCCGTTPEHLKLLVEKLSRLQQKERLVVRVPRLASSTQSVNMQQTPAPFLIGERLNSQGSRIFKKLLLEEDFEKILSIANQQVDNGAHGLDVCTALTERSDEDELMRRLVKELSISVQLPLIIDTTELHVLETALKTAPGRCLINSTNLESGREKADKVFNLAKRYNAAVIALTIDEKGMAKTVERKLEIAKRIYQIAVMEHNLNPEDLVFDTLTFTLATGDVETSNSAIETIESIRLIKTELPNVLTSLGVSNVSFGLKPAARAVVNSVMLYHAIQAGLDMAIVNPAQIKPYVEISENERRLAEDLIYNRSSSALQDLIDYFEKISENQQDTKEVSNNVFQNLSTSERLYRKVVMRVKEDVEKDIDEIISQNDIDAQSKTAVDILNNVLLPAMKEVGEKFGNGELILPFVLQSAEVMKKAVIHLENYLDKQTETSKGTVVLATVYGDVHDIGKNLVKTILSNNGYKIIDLGKQVPADTIITKAQEVNADAIGLSALLVSTSKQMPLIVNELDRRGMHLPILIGGAAINHEFGKRIQQTDNGRIYNPGVFYCKDAFEGLVTMDALSSADRRESFIENNRLDNDKYQSIVPETVISNEQPKSSIAIVHDIPKPPSWGVKIVKQLPLEIIFEYINKKELFRLSWGGKNTHGEAWKKLSAEFEERLETMRKQAIHEKWLKPQAVYGYFPAQSDENDLIIYDPTFMNSSSLTEIARFYFPRQTKGESLCLSDYFAPISSGIMDVAALQVVTVGHEVTQRFDNLQNEGNYSESYYTHGLAVQIAEATAEYLHQHIRRELNIGENQGKRYSWGFPAIPDISEHKKLFQLLPAEKELNMSLTSAYQFIPEQSTAAIIVHHPEAKYFNIGERRIEQLLRE